MATPSPHSTLDARALEALHIMRYVLFEDLNSRALNDPGQLPAIIKEVARRSAKNSAKSLVAALMRDTLSHELARLPGEERRAVEQKMLDSREAIAEALAAPLMNEFFACYDVIRPPSSAYVPNFSEDPIENNDKIAVLHSKLVIGMRAMADAKLRPNDVLNAISRRAMALSDNIAYIAASSKEEQELESLKSKSHEITGVAVAVAHTQLALAAGKTHLRLPMTVHEYGDATVTNICKSLYNDYRLNKDKYRDDMGSWTSSCKGCIRDAMMDRVCGLLSKQIARKYDLDEAQVGRYIKAPMLRVEGDTAHHGYVDGHGYISLEQYVSNVFTSAPEINSFARRFIENMQRIEGIRSAANDNASYLSVDKQPMFEALQSMVLRVIHALIACINGGLEEGKHFMKQDALASSMLQSARWYTTIDNQERAADPDSLFTDVGTETTKKLDGHDDPGLGNV